MKTDAVVRQEGMEALISRLGYVDAERFAYDNAGNLVEDGWSRYEYDAFNPMIIWQQTS